MSKSQKLEELKAQLIEEDPKLEKILGPAKNQLRSNAGFKIIAERPCLVGDAEIVLAVRPDLSEYVTWMRVRKVEYYHGHYFHPNAFDLATKDFLTRE